MVTVLILTPLQVEYAAVSRHLSDKQNIVKDGAVYEVGKFIGKYHAYNVVIREPGMKNLDMALATERAIQHFKPQIAFLTGIAGGIKDVKIGDVAIAQSAFNYDAGKESENGFLPRPIEYHFSEDLLAFAQLVQRSEAWKKRTSDGAEQASVHIASVAAGDKVVAAVNNTTYERITQFLSHCKFLEMEAAGFGLAVQRHRNIHALVVRGISDMCKKKEKTDKAPVNWQERAAERASGVVMEMLDRLDESLLFQGAKKTPKIVVNIGQNIDIIQSGDIESKKKSLISTKEQYLCLIKMLRNNEIYKTKNLDYNTFIQEIELTPNNNHQKVKLLFESYLNQFFNNLVKSIYDDDSKVYMNERYKNTIDTLKEIKLLILSENRNNLSAMNQLNKIEKRLYLYEYNDSFPIKALILTISNWIQIITI